MLDRTRGPRVPASRTEDRSVFTSPVNNNATRRYEESVVKQELAEQETNAMKALQAANPPAEVSVTPIRPRTFGRRKPSAYTIEHGASVPTVTLGPTGAPVPGGSGLGPSPGQNAVTPASVTAPVPGAVASPALGRVDTKTYPMPTSATRTFGTYANMLTNRGLQWDVKQAYDEWALQGAIPSLKALDPSWNMILTTHETNIANTRARTNSSTMAGAPS